jgi:hypothetical protein
LQNKLKLTIFCEEILDEKNEVVDLKVVLRNALSNKKSLGNALFLLAIIF